MSEGRFDPSQAVAFDFAHGLVHVHGAESHAVVPAAALADLLAAAPEAARDAFAEAIGKAFGARTAARLGGAEGVRAATVEVVLDHLAGEIGLAGLGALAFERWGRGLVAVVEGSPLGASGERLLGGILGAALAAATGADVCAAPLSIDGSRARFLITANAAAGRLREVLASGVSWADAIARLHEPRGAS